MLPARQAHPNPQRPGFSVIRIAFWCAGACRPVYRVVTVLMASLSHPTETVTASRTII